MKKPLDNLLEASGVDIPNGGGSFKSTFRTTKLLCLMVWNLIGSRLAKKLHLIYDRDIVDYNVIENFKGTMAKKSVCKACDTYMIGRTNVKKCVLCVLLHCTVLRIIPSILIHARDGYSVRSDFTII